MADDKRVEDHYTQGALLQDIKDSLKKVHKSLDHISTEDLAPVDEFHIGGRSASQHFFDQLDFGPEDHVLDVGCGLGGPARFVASKFQNQVTGIDLTDEFIQTGQNLSRMVQLQDQVTLHQGSALDMPFKDEGFDGAYMMHVGMNIADKAKLFKEVSRVLRPGASFGIYDVMSIGAGEMTYPVPWAQDTGTSSLASPEEYKTLLRAAGFAIMTENNRHDFALSYFQNMLEKAEASGGPPPLGLHIVIGQSAGDKMKNMIKNISTGRIAPVEIIAQKIK